MNFHQNDEYRGYRIVSLRDGGALIFQDEAYLDSAGSVPAARTMIDSWHDKRENCNDPRR